MSETSSATPRETLPVSTTSSTTGGSASAILSASARSSIVRVSGIARIYCSACRSSHVLPARRSYGFVRCARGLGSAVALGPPRVQLVVRELHRLVLGEICVLPNPLQQVEPEVLAKSFLDDVGDTLPSANSMDSQRA